MFGSLRKKLEEITAQVNPFDGGKTASTVRASRQQAPPAQTINRPNQSFANKVFDQVSSNTQADQYRRQQKQRQIQDSTRGTDEAMRNLQKQALTGQVDKNVAAAKIRALGTSNVQPNTAENVLKPTTPAQIAGQKVVDTVMNRKVAPVALGVGRSAAGTVGGVAGLYDLASPGDGVNRVSKVAVKAGDTTDRVVKENSYNQIAYKGAQAGGDLATFAIGGAAGKALPGVSKGLSYADRLAKPVSNVVGKGATSLASKGFAGRVAGKSLQNITKPGYQAANAGFTALQAGKEASHGTKVTPMGVTTNLVAGGVAFPVAGAVVGQTAKPVINAGVNQIRKTNLIRPSKLNPNEVADLARLNDTAKTGAVMDEGVYQRGVQAAQKAGVDYNNPSAVDDLLGKHRNFDTISSQRKQAIDEAKARLANPRPLSNEIGAVGKNVDPLKLTEEQYLARNGAGFMDGAEPALHRQPNKAVIAQKNDVKRTMQSMSDNNARRAELRKEYQDKLSKGEITAPTRNELLIEKANGLPELESTQAAQRLLTKQGVSWKTPDPLESLKQEATPNILEQRKQAERAYKEYQKLVQKYQGKPKAAEKLSASEKASIDKQANEYKDTFTKYYKENGGFETGTGYLKLTDDKGVDLYSQSQPPKSPLTVEKNPLEQNLEVAGLKPSKATKSQQDIAVEVSSASAKKTASTQSNDLLPTQTKELQPAQKEPLQQLVEGGDKTTRTRPFGTNDTTNIKIKQRGGEKKIPVKPITIPQNMVGDAKRWKDVGSSLKTIDRNLEASAPDTATYRKIREFVIEPREQAVTNMFDESKAIKKELSSAVDQYGLKNKEVRADVMKFGEKKMDYDELVSKHGKKQADNIVEADKWFRAKYDQILDETNAVLRKFSQPEIPRRDNYYTHFSDDSLWSKVGLKLDQLQQRGDVLQDATSPVARGQKIDPKLLGQSEFTKPNKRFNPFAQKRTGDQTKFDAVEAFERYLVPTLHNKHLTESVVRTRMLTKEFQEATAESKNLPTFIRQLQEYGNSLAGKSNRFDRPFIETKWGNQAIRASQYLQKQMGRNVILGSVRSAIMQTAALPQSVAQAGLKNTTLGAVQQLAKTAAGQADEVNKLSPFIRRRYAKYDSVIPTKLEKAENVAGAIFEAIEETSTKTIWRAQHEKALGDGFKGKDAIKEADRLTERVVGGRQIGERAEAFRSVIGGNALQFQLEVNNMVQQMAHDWKGKPINYVRFFASAYVLNSVYEELLGDRPLPDVIETTKDMANDVKEGDVVGAVGRGVGEVLSNVPGGQSIASLYPKYGVNIGGKQTPTKEEFFGDSEVGRYGSPFPALGVIQNPAYAIPKTFGLAQVKRTLGGIQDYMDGESVSAKGEKRFDIAKNPVNAVRAGVLGSYGTEEGNQYIRDKNAALSGEEKDKKKTTPEKKTINGKVSKPEKTDKPYEDAVSGLKSSYGGKFSDLSQEELKTLSKTDEEAKDVYTKIQAAKRSFETADDLPSGLNPTAEKVYNQRARLTEEGRTKWDKQKADKEVTSKVQSWLPKNVAPPNVTNEVAVEWANLEKKKANGTLGKLEEESEKKTILRKAYNSELNEDEKDLYKLSEASLKDAYNRGIIDDKNIEKALAVEKKLYDAGLIDKESLARKLDKSARGYKSAKGGKGRKGGKKKSNFDYTKNLFASTGSATSGSVSKSLRAILENAQKSSSKK